jgi:2-polyprenyl-3-methyl-5-hydroxy-6-metoxy-1,4-benzoquinol methylase
MQFKKKSETVQGDNYLIEFRNNKDSYSLAVNLGYVLFEELEYHKTSRKYLKIEEYRLLKEYYSILDSRTVGHLAHGQARVLEKVIDCIQGYRGSPRVLDAGCGLGTHAIFFGLLGASVVGVDLAGERLTIANKRLEYYSEKYKKKLDVEFKFKNIQEVREKIKFNIIWSNQSISHIHPVTDFLHMAYENLHNGGSLLICDSNGMNPFVAFLAMMVHHRGGLYTTVRDPETSKQIPYAKERLLNPLILKSQLRQTGYNVGPANYSGFVPLMLGTGKTIRFLNETMARIPFIRLIGPAYVVSARRSA